YDNALGRRPIRTWAEVDDHVRIGRGSVARPELPPGRGIVKREEDALVVARPLGRTAAVDVERRHEGLDVNRAGRRTIALPELDVVSGLTTRREIQRIAERVQITGTHVVHLLC